MIRKTHKQHIFSNKRQYRINKLTNKHFKQPTFEDYKRKMRKSNPYDIIQTNTGIESAATVMGEIMAKVYVAYNKLSPEEKEQVHKDAIYIITEFKKLLNKEKEK